MALVWLLRGILLGLTCMACISTILFFRYSEGVAGKQKLAVSSLMMLSSRVKAKTVALVLNIKNDCFMIASKKSEIRFVCA